MYFYESKLYYLNYICETIFWLELILHYFFVNILYSFFLIEKKEKEYNLDLNLLIYIILNGIK